MKDDRNRKDGGILNTLSSERQNWTSTPFVEVPRSGLTERINAFEVKLHSSVKLLREEAVHSMERHSRIVSELRDQLDAVSARSNGTAEMLRRLTVSSGVGQPQHTDMNGVKQTIKSLQNQLIQSTKGMGQRISQLETEMGALSHFIKEREAKVRHQFENVERRFAAFESALSHIESTMVEKHSLDSDTAHITKEDALLDALETMSERLEELERKVGRMEGQPLSEIAAQITSLKNGQTRLKEQVYNLEATRTSISSVPPPPLEPASRPTPMPIARVKLESAVAHAPKSATESSQDIMAKLKRSIDAAQTD